MKRKFSTYNKEVPLLLKALILAPYEQRQLLKFFEVTRLRFHSKQIKVYGGGELDALQF